MKLRNLWLVGSFATAAVLCGGTARSADTKGMAPPAGSAPPAGAAQTAGTAQTAEVLGKLHHSNQMEVAMGKLAQEKGQAKDVKAFGKTLVTDHSAADKKVVALAKQQKIELPEMSMPADKMDKMKAASGADFDKAFAAEMLEDHKKDIAEAKAAETSTTDAKLKSLLATTIPVLEKHRDTAQKLVDKLGPSAAATGAAPMPGAATAAAAKK